MIRVRHQAALSRVLQISNSYGNIIAIKYTLAHKEVQVSAPTNMPIAPYSHVKHKIAWRKCPNFPLDAKVELISSHNPWRPGARAWNLFEHVLRKKPITTVQGILEDAGAIGYWETDVKSFLRWLYTWGDFIEVNGQRHFPKQELVKTEAPKKVKRKEVA